MSPDIPVTRPTWEPPWLSGDEIYPDDPAAAEALELKRDQRMLEHTTSEAPEAPPPGLSPNNILAWSGRITQPAHPQPPAEPEEPTDPEEPDPDDPATGDPQPKE